MKLVLRFSFFFSPCNKSSGFISSTNKSQSCARIMLTEHQKKDLTAKENAILEGCPGRC